MTEQNFTLDPGITLEQLIDRALLLLKDNEPGGGYLGCFSGGKDSIAVKHLAEMAGVAVEWHYHKTTIDPPELVQFIKAQHPDVIFDRPKHGNFFKRMEVKGFPTRRNRWCCAEYKEGKFVDGRPVIMGIRAEESANRKKRWREKSAHFRTKNIVINPIYYWAADELWAFIRSEKIPYCSLYDDGFSRLGCIGCPMSRASGRLKEFTRWPQYEEKWKRSFKKIWERRTGTMQRNGKSYFGDAFFSDWQEMWEWWLYDKPLPSKTQTEMFGKKSNFSVYSC